MFKRYVKTAVVTGSLGAMVLAATPGAAQLPVTPDLPVDPVLGAAETVEVPGVGDISNLADVVDIPGLALDDPVLDLTAGLIDDLTGLIDDVLAETPLPNLLSLQGEDAIDASIAFSQVTYDSSTTALLARDDVFADALTTGSLQGIFDAPLLLTGSEDLDRRTARELTRLGVTHLAVLGGEDAVNPLVLQKLALAGVKVARVGGPTRIETAAVAYEQTAGDATTAVLTRAYSSTEDDSQAYADLLAVSPWAAKNRWPVLLTQTDVLSGTTRDAITGSALREVVIIGGTGAVSQAVEDELVGMGLTVRRVSGETRYGTAVAIAEERGFANSGDADRLVLAEGTASRDDVWAPGFAAAAQASKNDAPILLTNEAVIPAETMQFITEGIGDNLLDGGPATMCASFVHPIACEAAGLLLLGKISDALDLAGLDLPDVPAVVALLEELGLDELVEVLDGLDGTVDGVITPVAEGDLLGAVEALTELPSEVPGLVQGIVGGEAQPKDEETVEGAEELPVEELPVDPDAPAIPVPGAGETPTVPVPGGSTPPVPTVPSVGGAVGGATGAVGGVLGSL